MWAGSPADNKKKKKKEVSDLQVKIDTTVKCAFLSNLENHKGLLS